MAPCCPLIKSKHRGWVRPTLHHLPDLCSLVPHEATQADDPLVPQAHPAPSHLLASEPFLPAECPSSPHLRDECKGLAAHVGSLLFVSFSQDMPHGALNYTYLYLPLLPRGRKVPDSFPGLTPGPEQVLVGFCG